MIGSQRTTETLETTETIVGCCKECCGPIKLIETFIFYNKGIKCAEPPAYAICDHCLREVSLEALEELNDE